MKSEDKYTYVGVVLDKSGSMLGLREDVLGGINSLFSAIREESDKGGKTFVSFLQFDDSVQPQFWNRRPETVRNIETYWPSGSTALYDAIGKMITYLQTVPNADAPNTAFLIKVFTDGEENFSREFTGPKLAKLIKRLQKTDRWTFDFIGANLDLKRMSQQIGINFNNTLKWIPTRVGTQTMSGQSVGSTHTYFAARGANATSVNNLYNNEGTSDSPADSNSSTDDSD